MEHLTLKAVANQTDQGVFEAVISTQSVDRERDIVDPQAMVDALTKWNRPIPLAWNHSTKAEDIFGSIDPASARAQDGEVIVEGHVDLETEVGAHAWRQMKNRTIGFSFGYLATKAEKRQGGGRHITGLDVFEITATPTPMNNDTRVLTTKQLEDELFPAWALEAAAAGELKAAWTAAYINDLPNSAFLYIEPGGEKDPEGKTTPRSLRHFPVKDASGAVDMPHLRNAMARIPQSNLSQSVKDAATAKAQRMMDSMKSVPKPLSAPRTPAPKATLDAAPAVRSDGDMLRQLRDKRNPPTPRDDLEAASFDAMFRVLTGDSSD